MRHAGADALGQLAALLAELRQLAELQERTPGTFYRRSRAFLHFHEDPAGLFADVRLLDDFERLEVTTPAQQAELMRRVRHAIGSDDAH